MASYVGTYQAASTAFVVTLKDDRIFVQLTGQRPVEVFPSAVDEF